MKIKIDKTGFLYIERGTEFISQYCPFQEEFGCGQWCPMFNEPREKLNKKGEKIISLEICRNTFTVKEDKFIDERGE